MTDDTGNLWRLPRSTKWQMVKDDFLHGQIVRAALVSLLLAGCNAQEPFELVRVTGTVAYTDGVGIPAKRVIVTFVPERTHASIEKSKRVLPGVAELPLGETVFHNATTHRYGDGIMKGRHKVLVSAIDEQERLTNLVPAEYQKVETTPLSVDATQNGMRLDIRVRKP